MSWLGLKAGWGRSMYQLAQGLEYSTIYIGGDDWAFAAYGSLLGLAEQVDIGNRNSSDQGFVFSDRLTGADQGGLASGFGQAITHEARHLIGYGHNNGDRLQR